MIAITLLQSTSATVTALATFILIIASYAAGNYRKNYLLRKYPDQADKDTSTISGAFLALLGLMLAFSFGMSNSRYDTRRQVIVEEANAIGTVILRTEIFPDSERRLLRSGLKDYVEARISVFEAIRDDEKRLVNQAITDSLQRRIWKITADHAQVNPLGVHTSQLIPALNDMIDIVTTRKAAFEATIPDSILYFLLLLCLISSFLLAHDRKKNPDWVAVMAFTLMLSATIFTIVDLDRPYSGLIHMDGPHQKIVDLRDMFNADE